ncbi:hypothetical protein [Helicobacter cetorum]|uniref:Uncharacterized protein n=1 Tax=Helicobacter cetorum (strain ATCC BAA-540 / CCUG 52418 / MIT 99-5656) TaxID=1163745 RepID=I0ET92_HELCM|nr:hypothetical protein [Helicobacter cetorum]AFI06161.1 hypothetical protein HCD_05795 [Helicobacter cetorum MIT 99-5656]
MGLRLFDYNKTESENKEMEALKDRPELARELMQNRRDINRDKWNRIMIGFIVAVVGAVAVAYAYILTH